MHMTTRVGITDARQKKRSRKLHVCVGMQISRGQFTRKNTKDASGFSRVLSLAFFTLSFSPLSSPPSLFYSYISTCSLRLMLSTSVYFQLSTVHYPVAEHCLTTTFLPFHPSRIRFRS